MSDTLQVLGQLQPASGAQVDLCYAALGESIVISTLFCANQSSSCGHFTVSIAPKGVTDATSQIIYAVTEIFGNSTFPITCGIVLGSTDVLRVKSDNGQISFTACGTRVAP